LMILASVVGLGAAQAQSAEYLATITTAHPPKHVVYSGAKLTLVFRDAPVQQLLAVLAEFSGENIVSSDAVQGTVTLNLHNVPWDQALDIILMMKGLKKQQSGNVIWIDNASNFPVPPSQRKTTSPSAAKIAPSSAKSYQCYGDECFVN